MSRVYPQHFPEMRPREQDAANARRLHMTMVAPANTKAHLQIRARSARPLGGSLGQRDHEHVAARSLNHRSSLIDAPQFLLRQHDAMLVKKGLGRGELRALGRRRSQK